MWIKKGNTIINTNSISSIREESGKLILRTSGSSSALSSEIIFTNITEGIIDRIITAIKNNESILEL